MKQPDADRQPDRLVARERRVEPVDLDDAHGDQQARRRQQHRIGIGQRHAQGQVGDPEQREEGRGVRQRERRDDARARDQHRREADGHDAGHEQQQAELAIAARAEADRDHGSVCSSAATTERADSLERRWWSKRWRRREAGSVAAGMRLRCTSEKSFTPPPRL